MVGDLLAGLVVLVPAVAGGHVDLAADDVFEPRLLGGELEVDGSEHVAVVGHDHGVHVQFLGPLHEVGQADGPVQQAVLGVRVQMDEGRCHEWFQGQRVV